MKIRCTREHLADRLALVARAASTRANLQSAAHVRIAAESAEFPTWKQPVRAVFRQEGGGWKLVGLERMPDQPNPKAKVNLKPGK